MTMTPRWEYRIFRPSLAWLEGRLRCPAQVAPVRSSETYLLNFETPHSAKIRGGKLEVKQLRDVDVNDLERWTVAFQAPFPLSASALEFAFEQLRVNPPRLERERYPMREFLAEIVARDPAFHPVQVAKERRQFMFEGVMAELDRIRVGDDVVESFCIEHAEKEPLLAALRKLGLDSHDNTAFPKEFEQLYRERRIPEVQEKL